MADLSMDIIAAAVRTAWDAAKAALDDYKAKLPAEVQPAVPAIENIVQNALDANLPSIRQVLIDQFTTQFMQAHGPVAKSGVDLA